MKTQTRLHSGLATLTACLALIGCGSGSSGNSSATLPTATPPTTTTTPTDPSTSAASRTTGLWKGSVASSTTGQTSVVVALTGHDGHSVWMTADGRVWDGQVPTSGDHFSSTFVGHMHDGARFPDGTNHGPTSMMVDHHSSSTSSGRYTGSGDGGTFSISLSPMWSRPASLGTLAGVYTRSTSSGYTMTMSISADGQLAGSDSRGCVFGGTVRVPNVNHNMYDIDAHVTSCGSLDGHYQGMGTLLDADAMQDWMAEMHPLEHGGRSLGGPIRGGSNMMGRNTVPTGLHNLFMFSMVNTNNAIMDALGR